MYDKAMGGVVKSSYASMDLSYKVKLSSGETKHYLTQALELSMDIEE
jgi:hypothetical protein